MRKTIFFKKLPFLLCGMILTLATFEASAVYATTYYVAKNGNDSKNGSKASPFQTIKRGVSVLSPGDTLYVKTGTYNEYITNDTSYSSNTVIPNGTSWDKPVTVAANPGDTVTIIPGGGKAFFLILDGQDKYLIIDGFIIDGQNKARHGFKFGNGTRYIRVKNSEIKNSKFTGILVTNSQANQQIYGAPADTFHEFINLDVHHNGTDWYDHGFYIETSRNLVEYCDVHHNANYGGKFYMSRQFGGGGSANYNILRYSTLHENGTNAAMHSLGWLLAAGQGNEAYGNIAYNQEVGFAIGSDATDALLYNNIAYNNSLYGIQVFGDWGGSEQAKVYNNTVYNNPLYGIGVRTGAKNTIIKNNIVYKNGTNIWLAANQAPGTIVEKNLTTDPKFVDPLQHDFKLKSGSPAIDSGVNIPEVHVDFFNTKRFQGKAYDMGAIEQVLTEDYTSPAAPTKVTILQ